MSNKIEKLINKYSQPGFNQPVQKEEILPLLDFYFERKTGSSSHEFKLFNKALINDPNYHNGHIVIPVTGGRHIKPYYIKKVLKAISIIKDYNENNNK